MAQRKSGSRPASSTSKPKAGPGCLLWLILLLVTLLLFVVNWERIQQTLAATRFVEAVDSRGTGEPEGGVSAPAPAAQDQPGSPQAAPGQPQATQPQATQPQATQPQATQPQATQPQATQPGPGAAAPVELVSKTRVATLYFVRVDGDGAITRQEVKRTVDASDSPMTDALNALLQGPSTDELGRNLISLIPAGTKLLSAQVRGSTAYLNFNEAFMINRYGIEGYAGQLKQIVYTATGYATVKDVQFLIEGEKREYLGGEGVYIGKPLSRASF
jgi:germination protein M